jgi:hypothetical protein
METAQSDLTGRVLELMVRRGYADRQQNPFSKRICRWANGYYGRRRTDIRWRAVIREADRERDGRHGRNRRREKRVRELETRVEQLESQVRWLRRVIRANGESDGSRAVGPCPNCSRGVLVHRNDELRCSSCGYHRFI